MNWGERRSRWSAMDIAEILSPDGVRVLPDMGSKKRLFQKLGQYSAGAYGLDPDTVVSSLQDRESLGPTGVGRGVALPHARLEGLDRVCALFMRLERPLDFGSVDRQPVDLVFALFAPETSGVEHLKALALISRTMRDKGICAKLRANSDVSTLYTVLTENAANEAA